MLVLLLQCAAGVVPAAGWCGLVTASTTRSICMKREPFTRNVASGPKPAPVSAAMSEVILVKCCPAAPKALLESMLGVAECIKHVDTALRRIRSHFAMKRRPLVADFAHVAHDEHARRGLRREHSIAARMESGFELYVSSITVAPSIGFSTARFTCRRPFTGLKLRGRA